MSTSSADNYSAPLSTIDDSAPISGWLTIGGRLQRPFGNFVRHGRWRIGWIVERPQPQVLDPIGELNTAESGLPAVVARQPIAVPRPSLILPPLFADSLSFLVSALLHASIVIALAWWVVALPHSARLTAIEGSFLTNASDADDLTIAIGADVSPSRRWEVLASTLDDFSLPRASASGLEAAIAAATAPDLASASGGPVSDVQSLAEGTEPEQLLGAPKPGVEFFGISAHGNRFVFIVDCSASMAGDKWSLAKKELLRAVKQLGSEREFYVILFDGAPHPMFHDRHPLSDPLPATTENIEALRDWLAKVTLGFDTSPCLAVKRGLDLEPSAIFLLSNGEFTDPTASYLRENNRAAQVKDKAPRIVVNTVSFGPIGQTLLARIARENGGEFRKVSP